MDIVVSQQALSSVDSILELAVERLAQDKHGEAAGFVLVGRQRLTELICTSRGLEKIIEERQNGR